MLMQRCLTAWQVFDLAWDGEVNIIVREINFRPEQGAGAHLRNDLVQLWQDSAHKMIDAQAVLIQRLTGGSTAAKQHDSTTAKQQDSTAERKHEGTAAKRHDSAAVKKHE
jgi:hypothetical protein